MALECSIETYAGGYLVTWGDPFPTYTKKCRIFTSREQVTKFLGETFAECVPAELALPPAEPLAEGAPA